MFIYFLKSQSMRVYELCECAGEFVAYLSPNNGEPRGEGLVIRETNETVKRRHVRETYSRSEHRTRRKEKHGKRARRFSIPEALTTSTSLLSVRLPVYTLHNIHTHTHTHIYIYIYIYIYVCVWCITYPGRSPIIDTNLYKSNKGVLVVVVLVYKWFLSEYSTVVIRDTCYTTLSCIHLHTPLSRLDREGEWIFFFCETV
jgi:hypothetical protein